MCNYLDFKVNVHEFFRREILVASPSSLLGSSPFSSVIVVGWFLINDVEAHGNVACCGVLIEED